MNVTPYLEPQIAPRVIFDALPVRERWARYRVPREDGTYRTVTWGEHAAEIRAVAGFLSTELEPGDRAAILSNNRVEWMSAALGIQAVGGVAVPIYASSTAAQVQYVLEHSDARVVFVGSALLLEKVLEVRSRCPTLARVVVLDEDLQPAEIAARLRTVGRCDLSEQELPRRVITWRQALSAGRARTEEAPVAFKTRLREVSLDHPAVMLYTSGTSGLPKGVPLTHRNVGVNGADWLECNAPLLDESSVDLLWLPMSHIFGFGEACLGNTLGFTSYLCDAPSVIDKLAVLKPNVFMSVPSVWEKLAAAAGEDRAKLLELTGSRLRFCLSGGAGLKRAVKEQFLAAGMLIIEGYGLTECSPTLTLNRPDAFRFDSVGKPLPSVEVRLADDGEILARGASVFSGYHKDPEATRAVFTADGWLKTGDVGRWTEDGFLQIVDRKKDILVTAGGKNVAPANIEMQFRDDPVIERVVVYGDGRRYLVAGVWIRAEAVDRELRARGTPDAERGAAVTELVGARIDRANGSLAPFETIKRFRVFETPLTIEAGLLTPTLKIKRKAVYERFGQALEELYA